MFQFWRPKRIYLDTAAATPLDPRVAAKIRPWQGSRFGNPSSIHAEGVAARQALEEARKTIGKILRAHPDEIIFTSGGTEGDNLAVLGVARELFQSGKITHPGKIIVSAIEHHAVLEPATQLERAGWTVIRLPVRANGLVDLSIFQKELTANTALVSIMYANNEIGAISPLLEIKKIIRAARDRNKTATPYFHTDACQAARFLPLDVERLGADLLVANGSKIYGPKGSGFLYRRRGVPLQPIIWGGGQERGLRSGTENVAGAVGLAEALTIADREQTAEGKRLTVLRDRLIAGVLKQIPEAVINGDLVKRLPNNISLTFPEVDAERLVIELDARGIAVSTGSACSSSGRHDAHVIRALGFDEQHAQSTIRISLSRDATREMIDRTLKILQTMVAKVRHET